MLTYSEIISVVHAIRVRKDQLVQMIDLCSSGSQDLIPGWEVEIDALDSALVKLLEMEASVPYA